MSEEYNGVIALSDLSDRKAYDLYNNIEDFTDRLKHMADEVQFAVWRINPVSGVELLSEAKEAMGDE